MKIDVSNFVKMFDKLLPATQEALKDYWLEIIRDDGLRIVFSVALYEANIVTLGVYKNYKDAIAGLTIYYCTEIRILNEQLKQFEILHKNGRCIVDLLGSPVFKYTTLEKGNEN